MSIPFHALSTLVARLRGHIEWYEDFISLARHAKNHAADIGNLSVGSPPGVFAAYDTRFYVEQTGFSSNAYTAALSPVATGEALPTGYSILFIAGDANTGGATLNVGSTDGALDIKKYVSGSKVDLGSGDIVPGLPMRCTFDGTHWVATISAGSGSTGLAGINVQSGTTYTAVAADAGKIIRCTHAAGCNITINHDVHGQNDVLCAYGTQGPVTLSAGADVSFEKNALFSTASIGSHARIFATLVSEGATDTFLVDGTLEAA